MHRETLVALDRIARDAIDLARMRRDRGRYRGLQAQRVNVFHVNDADKVIAFHRWDDGGGT